VFKPKFEILPPPQQKLWPELAEVPKHFVLYGGTALALRLGHRTSVDFDLFTSESITPARLLETLSFLKDGKVLQNVSQTLTVLVNRGGPVKISFFGGLPLGRVGVPEPDPEGVLHVASLLDLAGTKAAVVTQRAEAKDYLDILALLNSGVTLGQAMAAATAIYGAQYNPMMTLKSLAFFGDGDLHKLSKAQQQQLTAAASADYRALPLIPRAAGKLSLFPIEASGTN